MNAYFDQFAAGKVTVGDNSIGAVKNRRQPLTVICVITEYRDVLPVRIRDVRCTGQLPKYPDTVAFRKDLADVDNVDATPESSLQNHAKLIGCRR